MAREQSTDGTPALQRLYDREWLLAVLAIVFFGLSYVAWGLVDILSVG